MTYKGFAESNNWIGISAEGCYAWSDLYSTKRRPFASPETGKIAIKVINHYGDEVMKDYEVRP